MLKEEELSELFQQFSFSKYAKAVIEDVRTSEPSRRVSGRVGNVCVRYASHKMECVIQAESHRNELASIYEKEHDDSVREFYDQPPTIKIEYHTKSGRKVAPFYTPDFFVIRKDAKGWTVGWEEWKMEEDLKRLSEENPNRYAKGEDGR